MEDSTEKDDGMSLRNMTKGVGIPIASVVAVIIATITVMTQLHQRDSEIRSNKAALANSERQVASLENDAIATAARLYERERELQAQKNEIDQLQTSVARYEGAIESTRNSIASGLSAERAFAEGHRVRLWDRLQKVEAREVERQRDMALIMDRTERMERSLQLLTEALLPNPSRTD